MKRINSRLRAYVGVLVLLILVVSSASVLALGSQQNPQSGSLGLEATIPSAPPSQAASIAIPTNNQTYSTIPISVSGLCPSNLLIKLFSNNVFVGSAVCSNGSYVIKADLFNNTNSLYVQDFDSLGQGGPLSNTVSVNFKGVQAASVLNQVVITSSYATLGANPGQVLSWPISISGGSPPYAISTDWGDGTSSTLQSSSTSGNINLDHTYNTAGTYTVTVTVTDSNGATGFLQLVGVANGQIVKSNVSSKNGSIGQLSSSTKSSIPWWVFAIIVLVLIPSFWLGSRHCNRIGTSCIISMIKINIATS